MKRFLSFLFLIIFLSSNIVYAETEPIQEDVPIYDLVKCNMFDFWCKFEKYVMNSAYGMQETNYAMINSTFSNVNSIQVLEHDPFIKDLNKFFMNIIHVIYELFFIYVFWSFMTTGGNLYKEIKAKENFANLLKGMVMIALLPLIIVFANDFFYQLNMVFISSSNFSDLVLYSLKYNDNVFGFWISTMLVWFNGLFLSLLMVLYKLILYFSTTLITLIGALWFIKPDLARLLRDYLILSYLHIPLLVILLNSFSILTNSSLGYMSSVIGFGVIILIFIALNFYIMINSFMKRFAKSIEEATKKGYMFTKKSTDQVNKIIEERKKEKTHRLEKEGLRKQNQTIQNKVSELSHHNSVLKADKDFNDLMHGSHAFIHPTNNKK